MPIPVIDLFAGPGGLGEGFSALLDQEKEQRIFKIALSIEMDKYAHQTLTLRSFFRQFNKEKVPGDYYEFIKGNISLDELFNKWSEQAKNAKMEAWHAKLGESEDAVSNEDVDNKIIQALDGKKDWLLIGGPPCQAYSVVGRSRRRETILDEKKDERVGLYKQYLRILAIHNPAVFIMENVKGMLSAQTKESQVFSKILNDLKNPIRAYLSEFSSNGNKLNCPGYRIFSLVKKPISLEEDNSPCYKYNDFIIQSEKYGIPQARHRVILFGIRKDINLIPELLVEKGRISISSVLLGLPKIRSTLSKRKDSKQTWRAVIEKIIEKDYLNGIDKDIIDVIQRQLKKIAQPKANSGKDYLRYKMTSIDYLPEWYLDEKLEGVCNHKSRGHMESDLLRYFFVSCFAKVKNRSPKLKNFPMALLPAHKNIQAGIEDKKYADRFRVQLWDKPCKTITSHISKDGHYFIHPDATQCRSFTVREAARIQTFPDNYYFCGPRTSQFIQVGNAVPPFLANQIAKIVFKIFKEIFNKNENHDFYRNKA